MADSSLAIRQDTVQAAVATEIARRVLSAYLARPSVTRCQTAGPQKLALNMMRESRNGANVTYGAILAVLLLPTTASQLNSTVLLSDFDPGKIVCKLTISNLSYAFDGRTTINSSAVTFLSKFQGANY